MKNSIPPRQKLWQKNSCIAPWLKTSMPCANPLISVQLLLRCPRAPLKTTWYALRKRESISRLMVGRWEQFIVFPLKFKWRFLFTGSLLLPATACGSLAWVTWGSRRKSSNILSCWCCYCLLLFISYLLGDYLLVMVIVGDRFCTCFNFTSSCLCSSSCSPCLFFCNIFIIARIISIYNSVLVSFRS